MGYLDRVANRLFAATLYYAAYSPMDERLTWPMRFKRLIFVFPFVSILAVLVIQRGRLKPGFIVAAILYTLALLPYVLISYYDRYAAPLAGIKMILVLYGIDCLVGSLARSPNEIESSFFGEQSVLVQEPVAIIVDAK